MNLTNLQERLEKLVPPPWRVRVAMFEGWITVNLIVVHDEIDIDPVTQKPRESWQGNAYRTGNMVTEDEVERDFVNILDDWMAKKGMVAHA